LQCEALLAGVHRNRLMEMHARVLDRLYAHADPSMPDADHAQLAQRNENAGRLLAAQCWRKAALIHAQHRHAFAEVSHHAQSLVNLIRQSGGDVASVELFEALMCLASAQAAQLGYGASAAQETYGQALKEALRLQQVDAEFAATWALWLGSSSASGYNFSYQLACRLQTLADHRHEQHQAMAAYALGNTLVCLGRFQEATDCLRQLPTPVWNPLPEMPDDAVAHGLAFLALAEWMSGHPLQARQAAARALDRARQGAQPSTLGFVLSLVALLHTLGHDWPVVSRLGKKITQIGRTHELALWQASGALMCEASAVAQGHTEAWTSLETIVLGLSNIMSGVEGFFLTVLVNAGLHSRNWKRLGKWVQRGLTLREQRQDHFFEIGFLYAAALCQFQGETPPSKFADLEGRAREQGAYIWLSADSKPVFDPLRSRHTP
jgi:tetratricopeptide (TPR) repeat protein